MTAEITAMRPRDRVRQDSEPIAMMYRTMGTQAAEQVVNRALAELALTMAGLADQVRDGDVETLARQLRRLQRMAEQLGLVSMGQIAADARHCQDRPDPDRVRGCVGTPRPGRGDVARDREGAAGPEPVTGPRPRRA